ncbi:MAG TPA: hypothetical protein VMJ90_06860 [Anaerolineales bacterium]|nr:hypothetical protein [Anaerolineales bacterium]
MKKHRIFFALAVLILASLACQGFSGGNDTTSPGGGDSSIPTEQGGSSGGGNSASSASGFPITADAYNVIDIGDGSVLYYTNLSLEDVMAFYRTEYVSQGYTERSLLTVVAEGTFSMVFDGDPSGKAVVIQSVDLGDGSRTVSVRLEDV